jgi:ribonuclease HII
VISTLNQKMPCSQVILDGNKTVDNTEVPITPVIKADRLITGVSAASILAKVSRDDYMKNIADQYPLEFRDIFIKGKGYRYNKSHDELIKKGIYTNLHRKSYNPLRTVLAEKEKVVVHHTDSINPLHQLSNILITPQDQESESN